MNAFAFTQKDLENLIEPRRNSPFVFLETASFDKENGRSILFTDFSETITFSCCDNMDLFFKKIDNLLQKLVSPCNWK